MPRVPRALRRLEGLESRRLLAFEIASPDLFDFNRDGIVPDSEDVDLMCQAIQSGTTIPFDLDGSLVVNHADLDRLLSGIYSYPGDVNLDHFFDSSDLLAVMVAGNYETSTQSLWSQGDWNCDGFFDSSDLIDALQIGAYEQGLQLRRGPELKVVDIGIRLADFDRDGDLDPYTLDGWFENGGSTMTIAGAFHTFPPAYSIESGGYAFDRYAVDIDNDGDIDLVEAKIGQRIPQETWWSLQEYQQGEYTEHRVHDVDNPFAGVSGFTVTRILDVKDFDGDGHLDLLAWLDTSRPPLRESTQLAWFPNPLGNGQFTSPKVVQSIDTQISTPVISVDDFDFDGDLDLFTHVRLDVDLTGVSHVQSGRWFLNQGDGTFDERIVYELADFSLNHVAQGPRDGNQRRIIVATTPNGEWRMFSPEPIALDPLPAGSGYQMLGFFDLDNDGDDDGLFRRDAELAYFWIERVEGNETMREPRAIQDLWSFSASIVWAEDVNGDGSIELYNFATRSIQSIAF